MSALADVDGVKAALGITDTNQDAQITFILAGIDGVVEGYCGRPILETARVEYLDGGGAVLQTSLWPVASDPALVLHDTYTGSTISSDFYTLDLTTGLIHASPAPLLGEPGGRWARGPRRWRVTYTGGEPVAPQPVVLAIAEIVAVRLKAQGGVQSESDMGYSYSLAGDQAGGMDGIPPVARTLLAKWRAT